MMGIKRVDHWTSGTVYESGQGPKRAVAKAVAYLMKIQIGIHSML
jgi:hypothetical protein